MKKVLSLIILLMAVFMAFPTMAQTKKKAAPKRTATAVPAVVKGEIQEYEDYLTTQFFTIKKGKSSISVEYPIAGKPALVNSIRNYIKNLLAEEYKGSLATPDGLLKSAIKGISKGEQLEENIKVEISSKHIITFTFDCYMDMGGAHGFSAEGGKTFLVENGKEIQEYETFPEFKKAKKHILESLANYFETTVSGLSDVLFISPDEIEEPENVFLTKEGLIYLWGPGEIAPESAGLPKAKILNIGLMLLM